MDEHQQQPVTVEYNESHQNVFQAIQNDPNKNSETLIISTCPSIYDAIGLISDDEFIKIIEETLLSILAIRFQINQTFDSSRWLTFNEMCKKNQLLIIFESKSPKNKNLHWINFKSHKISHFELSYSTAMNDFIIDFIMDSFKNLHDVFVNNSSQYILTTFKNSQNCNLLLRAASIGNQEILNELLKMPFDINQKSNLGLTAADLASERQHFDILCLLLENNSTFPKDFNENDDEMNHEGIKKHLKNIKKLHFAIDLDDKDEVKEILEKNPSLVYFYDTSNQSAATKAVNKGKFEIYELLLSEGRCIGPFEDVDRILGHLEKNIKNKFRETHAGLAKTSEGHITIILSRCVVSHDDQNVAQRHQLIYELLKDINELSFIKADGSKIPFGNYLLRLIAAHGNFKIFFDFNRTSVQHMDPTDDKTTNGSFYFNGNIYIAAKELLDKKTRNETVGATTHEFTHFASSIIFNNSAKPYELNDEEKKQEFAAIIELYEAVDHDENIVRWVYKCYDVALWPVELIVRPPHMIAHYYQNSKKLSELREAYQQLFEYFEGFFIDRLIITLEILEKLAQNDSQMTFNQLTEPLKRKIMQVDVKFQNQNIKLDKIASQAVLNKLKPSEMIEMINKTKKEIKIGKIVEEYQEIYIERDFIDFDIETRSKKMFLLGSWSREIIDSKKSFKKIVSETFQILLLSDSAGAGKSTSFKFLCMKLKNEFPNLWISYVDLKKYLKVYEKYSKKHEWQKTDDVKMLTEILKDVLEIENDFDYAIFSHLFGLGKVFLLLDGVDEIAPTFKDFFINLVLQIKKNSENQIWIATRPHHTQELKEKLEIEKSFKFLPWMPYEQQKFIESILKIENIEENLEKLADKIYKTIHRVFTNNNLSNPFLLKMFTESYLIDGVIDSSNLFSLYQKVVKGKKKVLNDEKGFIANADRDNESTMTIWEVYQVYALKTIFINGEIKIKKSNFYESDLNNFFIEKSLKNYSIMKKWGNEKSKWSPEKISRYGFLYVDNWNSENERCDFIHRTVAEFFVAKFLVDNFYEFGDRDLSCDEGERRIVMLWKIAHENEERIISDFIQSYLKTDENFKECNETFLKCLQNDWIQDNLKSPNTFNLFRVLKCFWRHPGALKILILPENDGESLFQYYFLKEDSYGTIYDIIKILQESVGENWPDFTGYKKINQNKEFLELESYSNSSDLQEEVLLRLLNFISQMQIPKEHLELFFMNYINLIGSLCDEKFLKSEIYKKFKKQFKSYYVDSTQDLLQLIRVTLLQKKSFMFDIEILKFLDNFLSPEFNFSNEYFVNNTFYPKFNGLIKSILDSNHDVVEFCKTKFEKKKFQEILSENFYTAIFFIEQYENLLNLDWKLLQEVLSEYFPSNMDENEKKLLNKMLTKKSSIPDDENDEEKFFGLSIMDILPMKIKILEDKLDKNRKQESKLKHLKQMQKILTDNLSLI